MRQNEDDKTVAAVDVKQVWGMVGGSQREERLTD